MATVYRCDRCTLIGETSDYLTEVVVPASPERDPGPDVPGTPKLVEAVDRQTVGICQDCLTKLRTFVARTV